MTVHGSEARLTLRGDEPGLTVHLATGSAGLVGAPGIHARAYERVCTVPCEASLPVGTYTLAVSRGNGPAVEVEEPVHLSGPSILDASYSSHSGTRTAGWLIFVAGTIGDAVIMTAGMMSTQADCGRTGCLDVREPDYVVAGLGIGVMAVSVVAGMLLAFTRDCGGAGLRGCILIDWDQRSTPTWQGPGGRLERVGRE